MFTDTYRDCQVPEGVSGMVNGVSGIANSAAGGSTSESMELLGISAVTSAAVSVAYFAQLFGQ